MQAGERIAGRFELERVAGSGGMGTVWRALDHETGGPVALKVLRTEAGTGSGPGLERFAREARVLGELSHPALVRYVAHGADARGPWLAMEWVEGEDLGARIARGRLTVGETLALAERLASALAAVHARGTVHRDVKPGNVLLPGGSVEHAKLGDFGLARPALETRALTAAGAILGTPGYMAPEQARGALDVDARADVFSLGCVLFECLTGRPAFEGTHVLAVLAKLLLEDAPAPGELVAGVPAALDALLGRMLRKDAAERPADGAAVLAELGALGGEPGPAAAAPARASLSQGAQRLVSVLLVGVADTDANAPTVQAEPGEHLAALAAEHGGELSLLLGGRMLVRFSGAGSATDWAAAAARCALALRRALPGRPMALGTGRALEGERAPVGEAIERAARRLSARAVGVDEVTAALLDARFELHGLELYGERASVEPVRTLMGKPTPCVGRERELRMLEELWDEAVSEPRAQAVLLVAEAGVGKSRVRHELIRRLRQRGERMAVWMARGDPMRAGSSLSMVADIVRALARIEMGEPLEVTRRKLEARADEDPEFLAEIVGRPWPDEGNVQLRAARADAMLMADRMRQAWLSLVEAELRASPLLIVLEDLHWGDAASVSFVDSALRLCREQPLLVLGVARPEVHELFPKLWAERAVQQMRLRELPKRACEELVRHVLGESAAAGRIVEAAAGNAFFLEELVRAEGEGRGGDAPETVLAVLEARMEALSAEARRVLRAGSVLGQVFWRGAVAALCGGPCERELRELEAGEWVTRRSESRYSGEVEYAMQHALVREAAYGMLTAQDRALGHRLAAGWLERAGEADAAVLADHHERAGERASAARCWTRATGQALECNDLGAVLARAERALACGAAGRDKGEVLRLRAEAHAWRGEFAEAERDALEAAELLPDGSDGRCHALGLAANASAKLAHRDVLEAVAARLEASWERAKPSASLASATARAANVLLYAGAYGPADRLSALAERAAHALLDEPLAMGRVLQNRAARALCEGDRGGYRELTEAALARYERAGDVRLACQSRAIAGYACLLLGQHAEAERQLRTAGADADRLGLSHVSAAARHNLGLALARLGRTGEALEVESGAARALEAQGDRRLAGGARTYVALILMAAGRVADAEAEASGAVDALAANPPLRPYALAVRARARLALGRVPEALADAREAQRILGELGRIEEGEALVRLAFAEALHAAGDETAARAAIAEARAHLLAAAAKIRKPEWRESFLHRVPEHARTLELARALLGES